MVRILKIGGSIITDKQRHATLREDVLNQISQELSCTSDLVLVHGAGSFGHTLAKKYGLPDRFDPKGILDTHLSVADLNYKVLEALSKAGVLALPVHPLSITVLKGGRIVSMDLSSIKEMLRRGIMPVLHGDVAMDVESGAGIVSGDQLVTYLARNLNADLVALGTNVDGVLRNGMPMPYVSRADLTSLSFNESGGVDVTGGMRGKLEELMELAAIGIGSTIFNAGVEGNVRKALSGGHVGTKVLEKL